MKTNKILLGLAFLAFGAMGAKADDEGVLTLGDYDTALESYSDEMCYSGHGVSWAMSPTAFYYYHTGSQIIYTKDQLTELAGKEITAIKYAYFNQGVSSSMPRTINVYLQEVDENAFVYNKEHGYSFFEYTQGTQAVASYAFEDDFSENFYAGGELVLTLDAPFAYSGDKSLVVTITCDGDESAGAFDINFYCNESVKNAAMTFCNDSYSFADFAETDDWPYADSNTITGLEQPMTRILYQTPATPEPPAPTRPVFSGGKGTADEPWLISNHADLDELDSLTTAAGTAGQYFRLTDDITEPYAGMVGTQAAFKGQFDGASHTIALAIVADDTRVPAALFARADSCAIHDLAVEGTVSAPWGAAIVGEAGDSTQLANLVNYAAVTATSNDGTVGGVVGRFVPKSVAGSVKNCANYGTITGNAAVGGVIGRAGDAEGAANTVENLANYGHIVGSGVRVGGAIGRADDAVKHVASFGTLSGTEAQGAIGMLNATDASAIYYDKQFACLTADNDAQAKNTEDMVAEQLADSLGEGWTYAIGLLPRPTMGGLENDARALLAAVPVMFADGDNLNKVTKSFTVGTAIDNEVLTWTAKNGLATIQSDGVVLLDAEGNANGEETLTVTYQGVSRDITFTIDVPTSIRGIAIDGQQADDAWYTIGGQRVSKPSQGLYIHNGKAEVVK